MKWLYAFIVFLMLITLPVLVVSLMAYMSPDPDKILDCFTTEMNQVYLCESSDNYANLDQISDIAKSAILLSEDASFYSHKGFDWHELKQSIKTNIWRMKYARGGSTITQQLVKNSFLSGKKSLGRKLQEAFLAQQVEEMLTKDKIFELYLNVVEFGENIYGIKHASEHYFQKPAIELNALEAAYLAYLLPSPKLYSQIYYKEELTDYSTKRLRHILRLLYKFKRIEKTQYEAGLGLINKFPWVQLSVEEQELLYGSSSDFDSPLDDEFFLDFGGSDIGEENSEDQ